MWLRVRCPGHTTQAKTHWALRPDPWQRGSDVRAAGAAAGPHRSPGRRVAREPPGAPLSGGNPVRASGQGSVHLFLSSFCPGVSPSGEKSVQEDQSRYRGRRLITVRKIKPKVRRGWAPLSFLKGHVTKGRAWRSREGARALPRALPRAGAAGQRCARARAPSTPPPPSPAREGAERRRRDRRSRGARAQRSSCQPVRNKSPKFPKSPGRRSAVFLLLVLLRAVSSPHPRGR